MSGVVGLLRQAVRGDAPAIWRVRYAVTENTLTPGRISEETLFEHLERLGRGWVVEVEGEIVAFAIGRATDGHVWGLFVHPSAQGQGHGARLHDAMVAWLFERGFGRLWLGTGNETRARAFYERHGWRAAGPHGDDETRYELDRNDWRPAGPAPGAGR